MKDDFSGVLAIENISELFADRGTHVVHASCTLRVQIWSVNSTAAWRA